MVSDNAREMSISACGRVNYSKISLKAWTLAPLGRGTWWMPETGSLASAWPHAQGLLSRSWFPVHSQGWCGRWVGTTKVFSSSRCSFYSECAARASIVMSIRFFRGAEAHAFSWSRWRNQMCVYLPPQNPTHCTAPVDRGLLNWLGCGFSCSSKNPK